jgi:hypothetical protein
MDRLPARSVPSDHPLGRPSPDHAAGVGGGVVRTLRPVLVVSSAPYLPVDALALAWTPTQGLVQVAWLGGPVEVWVPAGDILRVYQLAEPVDDVARLLTPSGLIDVPARAHAHAKNRAGDVVAQRVRLPPGTEQQTTAPAGDRWLLLQHVLERKAPGRAV